jgi:hypothetical protein
MGSHLGQDAEQGHWTSSPESFPSLIPLVDICKEATASFSNRLRTHSKRDTRNPEAM